MNHATQDFIRPGHEIPPIPNFPYAPSDWTQSDAIELAAAQNLTLTEDHWRVVRALQEFHARHEQPAINMRELHDALDEDFHREGGIRYLYTLFPNGPVAQGCLLAGLTPPAGAQDKGFGSAM
jgi:TusE/DsrC/DsvC family sulfur relay protein